ncbi:MAG TPA: serine/threonine-protein kinase, partial [Vicinamibacterales bacterium]|nr:serine/threonine-protein kinase [Vicinamibacterales bacterium]
MALPSGTRFGPYEVIAPIAAGGMGEVYRAVDRTLGRHVALKVLPDSFAQDADRLARFEREARTLASLNHPNIAQVYGLEERDGVRALVMELVEGPTLADRLAQGALRVEEALLIADQIGEALAAAHDQGVVHRDLKPANIMIGAGDRVKVLDFGLAKKVSAADGPDLTTVSRSLAATSPGTQMGTLPYMSPEQVRGEPLDARTDLWAFGCVLYELLAGAPAFRRATSAETIAAILGEPPDVAKLPPSMPAGVRLLIERCLRKDPKRRLHHAADARIELADATAELTGAVSAASSGGLAHRRGRARLWVPGVLAAVGLVAVGAIAVAWLGRGPSSGPAEGTVVTFSVPLPNDTAIRPGEVHTYVAVS